MTTISKVVLAGMGNLGVAVARELLEAGCTVTVLTRSRALMKEHNVKGITAVEVNYTDASQLKTIFSGQDAVVSTVSGVAILDQKPMVDAAIAAGVKMFIPSEFGGMTGDPRSQELPGHNVVFEMRDYLRKQTSNSATRYAILLPGAFLPVILNWPFLVDFPNRAVTLYDGGHQKISCSTYRTIGKAVVSVLQHVEQFQDAVVRFHDFVISQRLVLDIAKSIDLAQTWTVKEASSVSELQAGLASFEKAKTDPKLMSDLLAGSGLAGTLRAAVFSGRYEIEYSENENVLLGVNSLNASDLEDLIRLRMKGNMV